jgi:hypothetical protein
MFRAGMSANPHKKGRQKRQDAERVHSILPVVVSSAHTYRVALAASSAKHRDRSASTSFERAYKIGSYSSDNIACASADTPLIAPQAWLHRTRSARNCAVSTSSSAASASSVCAGSVVSAVTRPAAISAALRERGLRDGDRGRRRLVLHELGGLFALRRRQRGARILDGRGRGDRRRRGCVRQGCRHIAGLRCGFFVRREGHGTDVDQFREPADGA